MFVVIMVSTCLIVCLFPAVKEAAVQRRHNLYRDSIVLTNSDPNLHLLGENPPIDWTEEFGGGQEEVDGEDVAKEGEIQKRRRIKQVVSMIQLENTVPVLLNESCLEVPTVDDIPEEEAEGHSDASTCQTLVKQVPNGTKEDVNKNEVVVKPEEEEIQVTQVVVMVAETSQQDTQGKSAIESAIQEIEIAVEEEEREQGGAIKEQNIAQSSPSKEETAAVSYKDVVETPASGTNKDAPSSTDEKPSGSPSSDQQETNHITKSTKDTHSETDCISPSRDEAEGEESQKGNEACSDSETLDTGEKENAQVDHQ